MAKADGVANRVWCLPEETLYLLERGTLDVRWPLGMFGQGAEDREGTVPMSLQAGYASMIGRDGLSLERFVVYSGLKRSGYVVLRAPGCYDDDAADHDPGPLRAPMSLAEGAEQNRSSGRGGLAGLLARMFKNLFSSSSAKTYPSLGPLVAPGLYRNYSESSHPAPPSVAAS